MHAIFVARKNTTTRITRQFKLTFDEYGVLDEVFQVWKDKEPRQLNSRNADVKFFITHQHKLAVGSMPDGVRHIRQGELL